VFSSFSTSSEETAPPSDDSVMRIGGAILLEQNEAWSTGKLYFDMTEYCVSVEEEKKAALSASMRAASELP